MIAKLLSFARAKVGDTHVSDVKCDPGGGANVTAQHFGPAGDDSHPLPGDFVGLAPGPGSGREQVTGYIDGSSAPKAEAGEKRIYSRDADGKVVAEAWLKKDGGLEFASLEGGITLTFNPNTGKVTVSATSVELDANEVVIAGGVLPVARQTDSVTAGPYSGSIVSGAAKTKAG